MKEVWKELQQRGDEGAPLTTPKRATHLRAAATPSSTAPNTSHSNPDEVDIWDTGFTIRDISRSVVRIWLGLQVLSLFFSLLLWREVSGHLSDYEDIVSQQCAPNHQQHGICVGPMWNISYWQDVVLMGSTWSSSHGFRFTTYSSPPTFLLVVVPVAIAKVEGDEPGPAPQPSEDSDALKDVRWSLEVSRTDPPQVSASMRRFHHGQDYITFEDLSVESARAIKTRGRIDWMATLESRSSWSRKVRYIVFVEDAATSHLAEIHASSQCSFGRSWKAFNEQHQGHAHRALSWCSSLLGTLLLLSGGIVYLVHAEIHNPVKSDVKYRFHMVVLAKFFLQDTPQQICIVLYLLGWYEANGLRCQMCLFDPQHCVMEHPFHIANLVVITCVFLSSMANQLLIRPAFKKTYTEDDICVQYCIRIGMGCIAVLPFTTGAVCASGSLLSMPTTFHILCAIPCGIGWISLVCGVCFPVMVCCDEDWDA